MIRIIAVNILSLFKRMLYSSPRLYRVFSYFPVFFVIGRRISVRGLLVSICILVLLLTNSALDRIILYVPIVFLLVFSVTFRKYNFNTAVKYLVPFYLISILYGAYQNFFGYTSFELGWIHSGLSYIGSENYFLRQDIRPFSFFAGINEFAVFVAIFSYYFLINKRYVPFIISVILIFLIGSRGVFLSSVITLFVINSASESKLRSATLRIILYSSIVYILIAVIYPGLIQDLLVKIVGEDSRWVVYGTFNARIVAVKTLMSEFSIRNFFFGLNEEQALLDADLHIDNFYMRLVNDFGLLMTLFIVLIIVRNVKNKNQLFAMGMLLSYGFYNDVIPSFYLMFNLAFVYFSRVDSKQMIKADL